MPESRERQAARWRQTAVITLDTARHLRERSDYRSCVSRAYYAAYQVATAACIAHGDEAHFPLDWNNPTHEQLPSLMRNNGEFTVNTRRRIAKILRQLRTFREDSDYRPGITVEAKRSREAILLALSLFELMEIDDD